MRKHLRFNLRTLLLALAIIATGLFWIRWPTMTASSFVAKSEVDPSAIMVQFESPEDQKQWITDFAKTAQSAKYNLKPMNRSFMNALRGVQCFDYGPYDVVAERGRVTVHGPYYDFGAGKMRR